MTDVAVPEPPEPDVSNPAKLIRLGTMVQTLLAELTEASVDIQGRRRLAAIHCETLDELSAILSEDLREELGAFNSCIETEDPSPGELRVAHAQLVGWMQGLLRGMQASAAQQAAMAQMQLQQVQANMQRRPGLPPGAAQAPGPEAAPIDAAGGEVQDLPGYL